MGLTIEFQGHKGIGAILGVAGVVLGSIVPYVGLLPKSIALPVVIVSAIVAGLSAKPGSPNVEKPIVIADPNVPSDSVQIGTGDKSKTYTGQ